MANLVNIETVKSYATKENAVKAFEKLFGDCDVRYLVMQNAEGRYFPVGLGEKALQNMVHFHFTVVG